jgi:hypothetical protein
VFAVESAKAALPAAVVAVSYATLTALGVAASVVEVLEVLVFSWTAPGAEVEAGEIEIVWGIEALTVSGAVA